MAIAISAIALVLAISLLTDFLDGEPQGEPCLSHEDCETGLCLVHLFPDARYCSRDCDRSSQCGVGLSCVDAQSLPDTQRGVGALGPTPSPSVCARSPR